MLTTKESVHYWLRQLEKETGVGKFGNSCRCETGDPYVTVAWTPQGNFVRGKSIGANIQVSVGTILVRGFPNSRMTLTLRE
jgi:hypothetical protein